METYEFASPDILVVPQVLSEVTMFHVLEDETHWVLGGGVHSDERDNVLVHETTASKCLFIEPLPMNYKSTGHSPSMGDLPCRSPSTLRMNSILKT